MPANRQKIYSAYRGLLLAAKNVVAQEDYSRIRRALDLAVKASGDKVTLTGELEVIHALSVARIVAGEMGLGLTSIITALLHDSINNLPVSQKELETEFGSKVVEILNGFSRITSIDSMQASYQAEICSNYMAC